MSERATKTLDTGIYIYKEKTLDTGEALNKKKVASERWQASAKKHGHLLLAWAPSSSTSRRLPELKKEKSRCIGQEETQLQLVRTVPNFQPNQASQTLKSSPEVPMILSRPAIETLKFLGRGGFVSMDGESR